MDYKTISDKQARQILEKYWQGESSLLEEAALRKYFQSSKLPEDLATFQPLFSYLQSTQNIELGTRPLQLEKEVVSSTLHWKTWGMSIAASVILVIASISTLHFLSNEPSVTSTKMEIQNMASLNQEQKKAFDEAKAALLLVSNKLNKGKAGAMKGIKHLQQ
jgi:hypothetical protein